MGPSRLAARPASVSGGASHAFTLAAVVLAFLVLYRDVLSRLVATWRLDQNYSHGFIVVPISCYLIWRRRRALVASPRRPSNIGLAVVAASVAAAAGGVLGSELFLSRTSMLGVIAGSVLFIYGWQHLRLLAFPLALLLLTIPIPAIVFNQVTFPMQLLASRCGELALTALGVPVLREGNVITLSNTTLEVAEACSGIRSLVSLLTLAIVYGHVAETRPWARLALALCSIPVAIVANAARVAGTGVAAHYVGPEAAQGFLHEFSGWLVFLVAFGMIVAIHSTLAAAGRGRGTMSLAAPATPSVDRGTP